MEFSDIALAKLLQTVPELGSLIINFQDVTEELQEDTGTQVGVFVLRSGSDVFYIPVVSKSDNVYPIDSVFFDSKKKFFPLTRKTVSLIVSSSQLEQGRPTKIPKTVNENPSVYELINPPRTGKYVYASSSRLVDFLSMLPDFVKKATFEKIAAEKSVYDNLDKLFGLKAIFDVLKPPAQSLAAETNQVPISVVTDANPTLDAAGISAVINDGFHVVGHQPSARVAVTIRDFNAGGTFRELTNLDGDYDYTFVMENGTTREAFIPKMHQLAPAGRRSMAIFTNGDYALREKFVAVGDDLERKEVLTRMFEYKPPVLLRDCYNGDTILLSLADGTFLGPFNVNRVALNAYGVDVAVSDYGSSNFNRIMGYRNFAKTAEGTGATLYVPYNCVVIKLGANISYECEDHLNCAVTKRDMAAMQYLGSELNLGYDGVEFSVNGRAVGQEPQIMDLLVVKEGIDPTAASNFVKEAKVTKLTKIYMTKRAESTDYSPAEVPQYGMLAQGPDYLAPNGTFVPNVQKSMDLGDAQVTEATIISELLQIPNLFEQIGEYLPNIEEAIDKLGRILFISRVHIDQLSKNGDADQIFAFLASLKSVYRLLGDNFLKLQEMSSAIGMTDTGQTEK